MNSLKVEPESVRTAASALKSAAEGLHAEGIQFATHSPTHFSMVSGLDQSGSMHGLISSVSQPEATKALADHLADAAALLTSNLASVELADGSFAQRLAEIGVGEGAIKGGAMASHYSLTMPELVNARTNLFDASPALAGRPASLDVLTGQLASSDIGSMSAIALNWANTANTIASTLAAVPAAMANLGSSAETDWVARAIGKLEEIKAAGTTYAVNASALATHTANLVTVTEANTLQSAVLLSLVRAQGNPATAKAMEEAFLTAFGGKLTAELAPVTPAFRQLLPPLGAVAGGAIDTSMGGAGSVPGFDSTPLPRIIQQAMSDAGYADLAHAQNPAQVISQFGRPNPDMLQSIAAGATPTQVASASSPVMPPPSTMAGLGGPGVPASVGAGAVNGSMPGTAGMSGGAGSGLGPGMAPIGAGFGSGVGAGAGAGTGAGARAGAGGGAPGGRAGAPGAAPLGAGRGAGLGSGVGAIGTGGGPMVVGAGAAPGGSSGRGNGSVRGGVAGAPVGAARSKDKTGKEGKVHAVTSAVEREGNLRALLGESQPVIPGVIGAWVREPRP